MRRVETAVLRLLQSDRPALLVVLKATFASAAAFELARNTTGSRVPALAAMAAIITVQVSGSQTVRRALEYSAGVAAGVIVAIVLTRFLGLHWWSIALLVLLGLITGRLIRLGSQANQIAISALLVMSLGSSYGWSRVVDTLIGSAVGAVTSLAVPTPSVERRVRRQIASAAAELTVAIRGMSAALGDGWSSADVVRDALGAARGVSRALVDPRAAIETAQDERRLSLPRARTGDDRRMDRCDAALTALDHATNQVRSVGRNVLTLSLDSPADSEAERVGLGQLLHAVAQLTDAWRAAVAADEPSAHLGPLRDALDEATTKRASLLDGHPPGPLEPLWVASLLEVERIIGELDPAGAHGAAVAVAVA
jgi:uncharacterized membrane protein YccC